MLVAPLIPPKRLNYIPPKRLNYIPPKRLNYIPPKRLNYIPPKRLNYIPPKRLNYIPPKRLNYIPLKRLSYPTVGLNIPSESLSEKFFFYQAYVLRNFGVWSRVRVLYGATSINVDYHVL